VGNGGVWSQQQELTASDAAVRDGFGVSVSMSGNTAMIGAPDNNGGGAAYVFVPSGGVWSQQQELTASDGVAGDGFGVCVTVSGNTAVVGAVDKDFNAQVQVGAAYVFVNSGGSWSQQQELTASDGVLNRYFGSSVAISGDTAVIGANATFGISGAAYVFARSAGVWSQQPKLVGSHGAAGDDFGVSVSVSDNTAVVGADFSNSDEGGAYIFVGPSVGTNSILVGSPAGSSSVVLSSATAWTATANSSVLHISPGSASGTGNAVVAFTYDAFTGAGTRTGTLTIAGLTVTVTQAGANYLFISAQATTVVNDEPASPSKRPRDLPKQAGTHVWGQPLQDLHV